jgi:endonuclease G, mitochondrial
MMIDDRIIQATINRYQQRELPRSVNIKKLSETDLFSVDTPARVERRLERIANHPLAQSAISADKRMRTDRIESLPAIDFRQLVQERVLGQNDLMPVSYLEYALRVSQSVGRVIIRSNSLRVIGYGTGSMISPRLLMTNNHVLATIIAARSSAIEFNYQSDLDGKMRPSQTYELDPDTFFITDPELDYTIVAVKDSTPEQPPLSSFGWNRLIEEQGKVIIGEYVNIIQHPSGEPKQLALRENQVVDLLDDFLHYLTDTAPGSSGAPVFNDQWELVALHHSGVPARNERGNILTIDNKIWQQDLGESRIKWLANEGVRISRIVEHLKQQNLSIEQKQLRDRIFDSSSIAPILSPIVNPEAKTMPTPEPISQDRSITWNIPLQVTVSLGQIGVSNGLPSATAIASASATSTVITTGGQSDELQQFIDRNPDLKQELRLLEQVRAGAIPYYDSVADSQNRNTYYGNLIAEINALNPQQAFNKLKELLTNTHTNKLSYKPNVNLYPWVDLQPDLKVRSIYSNLEFTPEQIIREDLQIERFRNARWQEMMRVESFSEAANFREGLDLLEAQLPFNCEHVVPQSWFSKGEPMRGDLHHLFACEVKCNSYRGNTPYFDFADFQEVIMDNCGKLERNDSKFEPGNGKGEVARATLYFLLRYPGKINNTLQEYKTERLETLLRWHQDFAITEHERHRNMAIFKKQGNRNPFIDFPDWVRKIDFSLGLG